MSRSLALVAVLLWGLSGIATEARGAMNGHESTCVQCHAAEEEEELSMSVAEWQHSVHALHEVSCDSCHGGDPREEDADESMSEESGFLENPSWMEMADFCGVCHEAIAASFHAGRFGALMREGRKVPSCATCHMAKGHRIEPAAPGDVDAADRCHSCAPVQAARETKGWLRELHQLTVAADASLQRAEGRGIDLTDLRQDLAAVGTTTAATLHEFDRETLAATMDAVRVQLEELDASGERWSLEATRRRRYGIALVAALSLSFLALLGYQRTLG